MGKGLKHKEGQFRLDIRKKSFYNEGGERSGQPRGSQKGGGCPSLEKLKVRLDGGLIQLKMFLLMAGGGVV